MSLQLLLILFQLLLLIACFPLLCHGIPPPAQVALKLLNLGSNSNRNTHGVNKLQQTAETYCQDVESLIANDDVWTAAPLDCDCTMGGSYTAYCTQTEPICLQIDSSESSTSTSAPAGYRVNGISSFVIQDYFGVLECFDYEEQHHGGAKVCYSYTETTCEVSINGVVCDSCEICDPVGYLLQVDCRNNVLPNSEIQMLDECQAPNSTTSSTNALQGTVLEFAYATACVPLDPSICVQETALLLQNSSSPIASELQFIADAVPEICDDMVGFGGLQCLLNHSVIDHDLPNLCEQAGGFYWQGTYEIRCQQESVEGLPTFYYAGTQVPGCSGTSCSEDELLVEFSQLVGDLADAVVANGYGTCTSTVGWGNVELEGPDEVSNNDVLCRIIEQDITDPNIFSNTTSLTCTCIENTNDPTILSAKCRHPGLLCLESTDTKPFVGNSTYSVEVEIQGFNTLAYSHCFDYQGLYDGATVCLDLDRLDDTCQVTVNGNVCDSCQVCNIFELFVTADCTNLLPETQVMNQCNSPLFVARSPLRFYELNVLVAGTSACGLNNLSQDSQAPSQAPIVPDDDNSTASTCVLQVATDSCKDLAEPDKTFLAETQLQGIHCDCHNFCNGEWIGCVAFGKESSDFTCDQSQLVAGCTTNMFDQLPQATTEAPKACPLITANANPATCAPLLQQSATEKCECYNFCSDEFLSCSDKQDQGVSLDCSGTLVAGCTTDLLEENVNNVERGSGVISMPQMHSLMVSTTLSMLVYSLR
jgi:hypothetical protein